MKGSNAERELCAKLWDRGAATLRAPGSGSIDRPSPDVVVVRGKLWAFELKANSDGTATFTQDEIDELEEWAIRARGIPYVGVKPDLRTHDSWYFLPIHELHETMGGNYSIRKQDHDRCRSLDQLF